MSRIRANQITNQSADGAPTVQNGLVISGVTTSTTFSGSGASLTSLPAANLTGTLPAISGANLTSLPSQLTLSNNADNRVITGGSGTNLNGEANLTFDGSTLGITKSSDGSIIQTRRTGNTSGGGAELRVTDGYSSTVPLYAFWYNNNTGIGNPAANTTSFIQNGSEKLRINSNGAVGINTVVSDQPNAPSLHIHGSASDDCRISFSTPTKSAPGSRIGYYGLSNRFGLDVYYGLEVRDVTRSYATIFKIDNNGYMTNNQPYGYVRFNTHSDTGGEQRQTNVYTHTVQNGMSHSSGRLTVPATGKYYIGIKGNILDNNSAAQYLYINGSKTDGFRWQQSDSTAYWKSSMASGVISLSANDYLDVYVTGQQDNYAWNMFTVYMLG